MKLVFPCTGCGACCKSVLLSPQTAWLDRGDGICKHFDENGRVCNIYENRPDVCNVRKMYEKLYVNSFSWTDFVAANKKACEKLLGGVEET